MLLLNSKLLTRIALIACPTGLLLGAIGLGIWGVAKLPGGPAAPYGAYEPNKLTQTAAANHDGAALYNQHCSTCHGVSGNGMGTAPLGTFVARNFTAEKFKFTDTLNSTKTGGGVTTDETLLALLRRGITGSPMPSFAKLDEAQLLSIIDHVRNQFVRPEGRYEAKKQAKKALADQSDEGFDEKSDWSTTNLTQWWKDSLIDTRIGEPVDVPAEFPAATPERLARGEFLYKNAAGLGCAKCHGENGRGDGSQALDANFKNDNGRKAYPRDLTSGVYRGGAKPQDLYRRLVLGIPGTPMPSHRLSGNTLTPEDDLTNLVLFVQHLGRNSTDVAKR